MTAVCQTSTHFSQIIARFYSTSLVSSPQLYICCVGGKTGTCIGLLQELSVCSCHYHYTDCLHPSGWMSEWMSKRASVCDLAGENFNSSVIIGLQLWFSHTLVLNGNNVRIWVAISSRVAAIIMKQSRGTYALVGIAASGFTDSIHQAEICAVLGYYAAHIGKSIPIFWDKLSVPSSRVRKSKFLNPWRSEWEVVPKRR